MRKSRKSKRSPSPSSDDGGDGGASEAAAVDVSRPGCAGEVGVQLPASPGHQSDDVEAEDGGIQPPPSPSPGHRSDDEIEAVGHKPPPSLRHQSGPRGGGSQLNSPPADDATTSMLSGGSN